MCVEKAIEFVSEQYVGLAITTCIWCIHGILGREITKYTVVYGVYVRFWPTLLMQLGVQISKPTRTSGWQASQQYTVRAAISHVRTTPLQRPH